MRLLTRIFNLNDPGWGRGSGGQNGSEPPKRPKQDGPPDLDQVWSDFNRKLSNLFGKGGAGGGRPRGPSDGGPSGPTPRQAKAGFGIVVAGGILLWLGSGFFIVQEGQVAVITQFGAYKSTAQPGFQWRMPYPIQAQEIVDVSQLRTYESGFRGNARNKVPSEGLMLTEDENIVDVQFVVQYRVQPNGAPDYLFKTRDPDDSVHQTAQSSMREIVGRRTMDFVLYEGRTQVASSVQNLMQQILDRYQTGILISSVAIQNVQPPEQVQAAFDDAVKAGQDRERQINEGEAYKNQVVPLARGQASRMLEEAEGYRARIVGDAQGDTARFLSVLMQYRQSPGVLRENMYLMTMEDVFQRSSKVFIDTEQSNNMLYLPLDRIMQQAAAGAESSRNMTQPASTMTPAASTPQSTTSMPARSNSTGRPTLSENYPNTLSRDRTAR
ncbi:FtsH protease activity modulator HflK [Orrella marina]|uniref:Protein HflK n=1 Tax=Orrella marina TaxID=2163011 RepID=A0A2R4XI43_9BURK|nr:FtsH protease activity modulator HflK [Orrella marina]AWB33497.1 FtsH protease activity modulator HflK [Orrella marina]